MDPVSHVVMGRAVIAAVERRAGERSLPGLSLAAIAGALVPDIDCVAMPMGWDVYLRIHQVGTHSIVGACALGGVVGLGIHAVVRGPSARWLAGSAAAAALSHLLLDLISGATLAVGWPFTSRRNVLPLVTMAEPWLVAVFVLAGAAMWWQRRRLRHTACIALAAITLLLGVKAVLYVRAMQVVAADPRFDAAAPRAIEARSGSWGEWVVFERDRDALRSWLVGPARQVQALLTRPRGRESSLVSASRTLDTVSNFLSVHELTFAVEHRLEEGAIEILWSDLRFCSGDPSAVDGIRCGLWFGGIVDRAGRPITQVVHVGHWTQTRQPPR